MSFGWSASDIYTLVVACYQLVENCRDGLTSASLQVKGLQNELAEFTTVLYDLQKVLEETNDIAFIDLKGVKQTIDACKTYLNKYKFLQQANPTTNLADPPLTNNATDNLPKLKRRTSFSKSKELFEKSKETSIKLGQALKYASWGGDQELQVLQKKFTRHRQTLSLYLQILERKRHSEENSKLQKRLYNVEAMVKDLHSERRLSTSTASSPSILPNTHHYQQQQQENGHEDYESIFQALKEQQRLALMETERADDDEKLQEWNDILSHLEFIHRRVLNAAERTANSTAQRRTGSASYQISLNRMLTPRHTAGTSPSLRPLSRVDTHDSGFFELAPVHEESSGLTEGFGSFTKPGDSSSSAVVAEFQAPLTPAALLLKQRTMSVNNITERPALSPASSTESVVTVSTPYPHSPRHHRTFSITSSESSFSSALLHWEVVHLNGWVKCSTASCRKPMLCSLHAGYDSNGQVYALRVHKQNTNSSILTLKLSTHRKRPVPHVEPTGGRDVAGDGILAYFIGKIDTEPKEEGVQFFFQDEKSLNVFESVVYGQELLFSMIVEKISSSLEGGLSDRQRIRVWRKGDCKSLLFYASKCDKSRRRYVSIQANSALPKTKVVKKTSLEFKLQGTNNAQLPDLKIIFKDRSAKVNVFPELDVFAPQFFPN